MSIETDGIGTLQTGVVTVVRDPGSSAVVGTQIIEILGNFVSVNSAPLGDAHQVYVNVNFDERTGVAMQNPDPNLTSTVTLVLLDILGLEVARKELTLMPGEQLVGFVEEEVLFLD